ncbi:MAG: DNA recombination protein RmuC [Solirubrobacterales bacterium]
MIVAGLAIGILLGALAAYAYLSRRNADTTAELRAKTAEVNSLEERMDVQVDSYERQLELVRADRKQLSQEMATISDEIMRKTSKQLAEDIEARHKLDRLAQKNELDKRTAEIKTAVTPVTEKLSEVQMKVESLEKDRVKAQSELGEQLKQLREGVGSLANEAGGLSAALRKPMGRGSWGEVQLRNVVELAGMIEHCDFETQVTVEGDDGRLRPDVTVNMPGGQIVVIDAKAPMEAFLEAQEAVNEDVRAELLAQHAHQVKNHINILRNKKYQDQFDQSPELVVMFVPSEGIYHAALAEDSGLLEYGLKEKVLIATPTTLIGLLRAIYYGWGQDRIARSAQEIADTGKELHKRILTFAEPLNKVGKSLGQATDSYNQAIASYEARVVPQLRRIEDAGAKSAKDIEPAPTVETTTKMIALESAGVEEETSGLSVVEDGDRDAA